MAPMSKGCRTILICEDKYSHKGKQYGSISSSLSLPLSWQSPPRKTDADGQRGMVCPTGDAGRDGIYFWWDVPQYQRLFTRGLPLPWRCLGDSAGRCPDSDRRCYVLKDGDRISPAGPARSLLSTARTALPDARATWIYPPSAAVLSTAPATLLSPAAGPTLSTASGAP
jgi:hypothetical protein